jgi:AraC-like DNA-binding protein
MLDHNKPVNSPTLPLQQICDFARAHANAEGAVETAVPGLRLMCIAKTGERVQSNYRPLACLVLQGAKRMVIGRHEHLCRQGESVIVTADMPVTGEVVEASAKFPYLALAIDLDMARLSEQAEQMGEVPSRVSQVPVHPVFTQSFDDTLLDCGRRLLQLTDTPQAIPFLHAGLLNELQYWLLTGPNSQALRASVAASSAATRVRPAVALLQARFRDDVEVEELAGAAAMSRAVFHRHFKAVTSLTPIQYQKRLRLVEARRLLRHGAASATQAAYEVGYESVPQFTRDYGDMFGTTPGKDRLSLIRQ